MHALRPDTRGVDDLARPDLEIAPRLETARANGTDLTGEGITCPVPAKFKGGAAQGKTMVAGFRPEHLQLGDVAGSVTIRAKADVVEFLGAEELLHVTIPGHDGDIVAVVSSEHRVKPGDVLDMKLPLDKLHLFDKETGDAVAKSAA